MTYKLKQQIKEHEAMNRVWIDEEAFPDPLLCSWCGATLALVSDAPDLTIRMTNFLKTHSRCSENACCVEKE